MAQTPQILSLESVHRSDLIIMKLGQMSFCGSWKSLKTNQNCCSNHTMAISILTYGRQIGFCLNEQEWGILRLLKFARHVIPMIGFRIAPKKGARVALAR